MLDIQKAQISLNHVSNFLLAQNDILVLLISEDVFTNENERTLWWNKIKVEIPSFSDNMQNMLINAMTIANFTGLNKTAVSTMLFIDNNHILQTVIVGTGKKNDFLSARARDIGLYISTLHNSTDRNYLFPTCHNYIEDEWFKLQLFIGLEQAIFKLQINTNPKNKQYKFSYNFTKNISTPLYNYFYNTIFSLNQCRLLQDIPANIATPIYCANEMENILSQLANVKVEVKNKLWLQENNFGGILAVSQGSDNEANLLIAEYNPPNYNKTIVIIGKGLTFDSGGYALKPYDSMASMKYDMSGAAVAFSSFYSIVKENINAKIILLCPLCENMIDAHAYKCGDVITMQSGTTVEVINTDAEGRLVLADVISYSAKTYNPDYIIDIATLTGVMLHIVGLCGAGFYAFNSAKNIASLITQTAEFTGDRIVELPTWDEYLTDLKTSECADLRNIGVPLKGSSSVAAAFLNEFSNKKAYIHIDIASSADNAKAIGYPSKTGTAWGVQLLINLVRNLNN